jgi:hypothetical protein
MRSVWRIRLENRLRQVTSNFKLNFDRNRRASFPAHLPDMAWIDNCSSDSSHRFFFSHKLTVHQLVQCWKDAGLTDLLLDYYNEQEVNADFVLIADANVLTITFTVTSSMGMI